MRIRQMATLSYCFTDFLGCYEKFCLKRKASGRFRNFVDLDHSILWGKKIAPFCLCNNFVKPHYILIIYGAQLRQICNKTLLAAILTLLCETKQVNLSITAVMYPLKVMTVTEKHIIENLLFVFGFETRIKTISPLICRLISEALLVADHVSLRCCFSSSMSLNMFLRVGFSRCLQALVHWCGFHAARGESERCVLLWYIVAQTVAARHLSSCWRLCFPAHHACARALSCCDTRLDFTPDVRPPNRPDFSNRLQDIDSHSGMRLSVTAKDVKHRWWAVAINRMTLYFTR